MDTVDIVIKITFFVLGILIEYLRTYLKGRSDIKKKKLKFYNDLSYYLEQNNSEKFKQETASGVAGYYDDAIIKPNNERINKLIAENRDFLDDTTAVKKIINQLVKHNKRWLYVYEKMREKGDLRKVYINAPSRTEYYEKGFDFPNKVWMRKQDNIEEKWKNIGIDEYIQDKKSELS